MKPMRLCLLIFAAMASSGAAHCAPRGASGPIVLPAGVTPSHYDIELTPDIQQMTFFGVVRIAIDVSRPTRTVTLNALDLTFRSVTLDAAQEARAVSFDGERQTVALSFAAPVTVGKHVLAIVYAGRINAHAAGLFAVDYETGQVKKRSLFTQFENSDARRFVPCWDEPAQKATFTVSAVVPADAVALSNMPIGSAEPVAANLTRVRFLESPKMSSYLLFFALGDFERVARKINGVDIGVVVKRGDSAKARFALDAASDLLTYYEEYFGVNYPLPKLDLVAAAGTSQFFSAMENWGAILYFERALLIDPAISTQADRRNVYGTVAHEMAHQWFGDLVTMKWWDGIWLNEGFASWMASKALDRFHPEWTPWLDSQSTKYSAMSTDARRGTHPVIQPIDDVLQANQAFDNITYSKGEAVIRMLENYVGEAAFRDGVRRYIHAHAYGNTVSDDLWTELDRSAATNVSVVAHDFTRQAGVPVVSAAEASGGIRLTQSRLTLDAAPQATRWRIPVMLALAGSRTPSRSILPRTAPLTLGAGAGTVINAGQTGYFRTLYSPVLMRPLIADFGGLSAADELGLINDSIALGYAGKQPLSDFLAMTRMIDTQTNPVVLKSVVAFLIEMDVLYEKLPSHARFEEFSRRALHPILASIGWIAHPQENQNVALLRAALLEAMSELNDSEVINKAREYFADYQRSPSALAADVRSSVLAIVALHADEATWEALHSLARNAASDVERQELYGLLSAARDPALANRALQLSLSGEAPVTTRPDIVANVANLHADLAFDFAIAHLDELMSMLEPDSRSQFVPSLAGHSYDLAMISKLHVYADAHIPASARQSAVKAEARIAYHAMIRNRRLPEVDRWLGTEASSQSVGARQPGNAAAALAHAAP